jgi:hypothetical protein
MRNRMFMVIGALDVLEAARRVEVARSGSTLCVRPTGA